MPTFTVHAPPPRKGETASNPERFAFVRDGFHVWALVFGPFWLARHRLWLALVIYLVVIAAVTAIEWLLNVPDDVGTITALLIALFMGLEASSIRRWTLTRRKWTPLGFVVGEDQEIAEQRFFAGWTARGPAASAAMPPASPAQPVFSTPVRRGPPTGSDVIGLFPEPGGSR